MYNERDDEMKMNVMNSEFCGDVYFFVLHGFTF